MDEKKVIKKNKDFVMREIEGKAILMPLLKSSKDLNCIYTLNETASYAWSLFDGKASLGKIKNCLIEKYDVSENEVEKELTELVKDLKSIKAIS